MAVCRTGKRQSPDQIKLLIERLKKAFRILWWSFLIYSLLMLIIWSVPRFWRWAVA